MARNLFSEENRTLEDAAVVEDDDYISYTATSTTRVTSGH